MSVEDFAHEISIGKSGEENTQCGNGRVQTSGLEVWATARGVPWGRAIYPSIEVRGGGYMRGSSFRYHAVRTALASAFLGSPMAVQVLSHAGNGAGRSTPDLRTCG